MPNQILRDKVSIVGPPGTLAARFSTIEISTADVNKIVRWPETCLFAGHGMGRISRVIETYNTWDEAVEGHKAWVNNPERVFQAIVAEEERRNEDVR